MEIPISKYKCQRCFYYFEKEKPGHVKCPICNHLYIDWLNWKEVVKISRLIDKEE